MDLDDIRRILELSREHRLRVSLGMVPGIPGYVRAAYLCPDNIVRLEYEVYGMDEGGAYYEGTYPSLEAAVEALEQFTGTSTEEWPINQLSRDAVTRPKSEEIREGHASLERAIRTRTVPLPTGAEFALQSSYWEQFEPKTK